MASMEKVKSLSVFLLCFNDSFTIGKIVEDAFDILEDSAQTYEVIVVNDGSTDGSAEVLSRLAKKYPRLRIATHPENKGYGAAVRTGLSLCRGDLIFYTDGDGQYDIRDLKKLLSHVQEADIVNGYLLKRQDPFYRVILGKLYQGLLRFLFRMPISYVDCDFRLFKKYVVDGLDLESNGGFVCAEMIKKVTDKGYTIKEVAVQHYPRRYSRSEFFKCGNICGLIIDCFKYYSKRNFLKRPRRKQNQT